MATKLWKLNKTLQRAALEGDLEAAISALQAGADPNLIVGLPQGMYPIIVPIMKNIPDALALLIEKGADVHVRMGSDQQFTPLHLAHAAESVELLLAAGAEPGATAREGITPLHSVRTLEGARLLVEAGADPTATDSRRRPPWQTVEQLTSLITGTSPKMVKRRAAGEAAARWLRAQVEGGELEDDTPPAAATSEGPGRL